MVARSTADIPKLKITDPCGEPTRWIIFPIDARPYKMTLVSQCHVEIGVNESFRS